MSYLGINRKQWFSTNLEAGVGFVVLVAVAVALWWWVTRNLDLRMAWSGFSPAYFLAFERHPEWFASNFPSGAEEFTKSAQMLLYLPADSLGIPPMMMMRILIGTEIVMLAGAAIWASWMIDDKVGWTVAVLTPVFLIAGGLVQPDFGRWGHPYYGWSYNAAYACILVGVVATVRHRMILAALSLSLCVWIHVTLGAFGIIFATAALLADWRRYRLRDLVVAGAIGAALSGAWLVYLTRTSSIGGGGIPDDIYVAIVRVMSVHWFPFDLGLFWERQWEVLIPFLSVMILFVAYLPSREGEIVGIARQIGVGCLAMLVLTVAGVLASRYLPQPFLLKLALQRSSSLILIFSLFFIVPGLWRDATVHHSLLRAALAALALFAPFLVPAGVPLALAVLLGGLVLAEEVRMRGWTHYALALLGLLTLSVGAAIFYFAAGLAPGWRHSAYTGIDVIVTTAGGAVVAGLFIAIVLRRRVPVQIILLPGIAIAAVTWGKVLDEYQDPVLRARAEDYMAAQQWAHDNTSVGTLFMPDPAHFYGWREVSLRPSFGNLREWMYTSWLYNTQKPVFDLGVARLRSLGLEIGSYLQTSDPQADASRLVNDVRQAYYSLTENDLVRMQKEFHIGYFVFEKNRRSDIPLHIVYENANFLIGTTRESR
ncbi:hypothetical protein KMZ29_09545 [Bradyrhizobium sediminis]|uniref:Uncharacterized protein n=1 Tax=Bradyrhizobium sediminis TaxID=2840469 RepID=A0A975NHY3_9BRAD|nr:hypothetical protein [Bradyrhizobium sediminis]QWG14871.1 hypothetical protein KMZ29_09545 [Bradyrhizobium sediminis]